MAINKTFRVDEQGYSDHRVRETWHRDEWTKWFFIGANIAEPEENVSNSFVWRQLPGTNSKYQIAIKRITIKGANFKTTIWASFHIRQTFADIANKGIPIRFYAGLNTTKLDQKPGSLLRFDERKSASTLQILKWQLFSNLTKNQLVPGSATITVYIREPDDLQHAFTGFPFNNAQTMESPLLSPNNGDVVFETTSPMGECRKLYASKSVLSARSQYYATMFKSSFAEGQSNNADVPFNSEDHTIHRTHVKIEDDFDLLHNVLYYLYTDQISFATDLTYELSEKRLPRLSPAEDIYAMADRLLLDELKDKAFDFLDRTCTVENITARAFSKFSMLYKEVGDMYVTYLYNNWEQVKTAKAYEEFLAEKEEADTNDFIEFFRRYRILMEDRMQRF